MTEEERSSDSERKDLNKEMKVLTKLGKLKLDITKHEGSYAKWKAGIMAGLNQEDERHASELHQPQTDLKLAEKNGEDDIIIIKSEDMSYCNYGDICLLLVDFRNDCKAPHLNTC